MKQINPNYSLKIMPLPIEYGNDFEMEVNITKIMTNLGVAVPLINVWKCRGRYRMTNENIEIGMILMEKWDKITENYLPGNILYKLLDKIKIMHDAGYVSKKDFFSVKLKIFELSILV